MKNIDIKKNEACKKWRDNNREKYRKISLASYKKRKEEVGEEYMKTRRERSKKYREEHLEERKAKSREYTRKKRGENKEAYNLKQKEYRANNKERFAKYYKKRKENQKIYARIRLLKKYNLTQDSYNEMLLQQEGKCALCKFSLEKEQPHIDHSHKTGKVRGILCSPCNIVLGHMEKTFDRIPDIYTKFMEYLITHSEVDEGSTKKLS